MSAVNSIYHIVINTYRREMTIPDETSEHMYRYIWSIINSRNCKLYRIGGIANHIHMLVELSPTIALSDLVRDIKQGSSKWAKQQVLFPMFSGWGKEYGALSCSVRDKERIVNYINLQRGGEGFLKIIEKHGIDNAIKVVETIAKGTLGAPYGVPNGQRVDIDLKDHHTTVSLFRHGTSKSWVLTAYTIDPNTDAKGRGSDLSSATQDDPIRTRAELGAALKSDVNIKRIFELDKENSDKNNDLGKSPAEQPLFSVSDVNEAMQEAEVDGVPAYEANNLRFSVLDPELDADLIAELDGQEYVTVYRTSITDTKLLMRSLKT